MDKKKEKILVAMSGGVDSSVAAALLLKQGYNVTGMFAVNYQASLSELRLTGSGSELAGRSEAKPCWIPDYRDAVRVAAKLGIQLLRWDFTKEYKKFVLDYMYKEYSAGRTPNPDVLCNKFVKFGVWLKRAKIMGFEKLATGHYAKISQKSIKSKVHKVRLLQAKDKNKDQTYFLHQLNQEQLSRVLFPLGDYLKSEVRSLAKKFDLPTAEKEESMGICFIGEVPMKEFLQTKIETKHGDIVLSDGTIVGKHEGLGFYTIGQRIGVQSHKVIKSDSEPTFVVDKDTKHNRLIVGYEDDALLYKKQIRVTHVHWISGQAPKFPLKCEVRLRHRQKLQNVECRMQNKKFVIEFDKPQRAPTPGQFAVLYKNGECLGGGVII